MTSSKIAVIGAGMAGLICAKTLADHGLEVTLFDKGRAPGGRTSRRRADPFQFDHGAQYFSARDTAFRHQIDSLRDAGVVDLWEGRIVELDPGGASDVSGKDEMADERFVGVPGMNAIAKHLAADLDVRIGTEISALNREDDSWRLEAAGLADGFKAGLVVLALPVTQAIALLSDVQPLSKQLENVGMSPCWAVLLGFDQHLDLPFDGAAVRDHPLAWIARNNSKPGRSDAESWVLHASPDWSKEHLEERPEDVLQQLQDAFSQLTDLSTSPVFATAHRWRYALADRPLGDACLFDEGIGLGLCGDWCLAGRIEAAFLSGKALAARLLAVRN